MVPTELDGILTSTPDTLGGAVRFVGTRVPVQALLDTLYVGDTVDDFLVGFPNVAREQAEAVIRWEQMLTREALEIRAAA
jgi:uncharacterized protein (DUF433 family)